MPRRARQAQQQAQSQQVPPMQETYPLTAMDVTPPDADGDRALVVRCFAPQKVMLFGMSPDACAEIGKKLLAPSVAIADATDMPGAAPTPGPGELVLPGQS